MYNLPVFKQLILLLHWILVTIEGFLAGLGLSPHWTWGLAIIGLTIIVRLILFPLTWKQYSSAQAMQAIQPHIKELQRKHKDDRAKAQQETMKLYQEHRVNPFASCLPLLLQLPVFLSLYAAIKGLGPLAAPEYQASVQALDQASFLWIPHLGFPDPYYILLVLYVVTQLISTELMLATQTDKTQRMLMRSMPIIFVFFLFSFPAGLFVYWVTTNLWTIGQQLLIRKVMKPFTPVKEGAKDAKPAKRSRIVDALVSAQKKDDKPGPDGATGKTSPNGQKQVASGQKQVRSGQKPGARPATKPSGTKPGAAAVTKPGAAKQGGGSPGGGRKQTGGKQTPQRSGRKPLPAKSKSTPATAPVEAAEPDTSTNGPAAS
jgi:YidC/Oxa1 family membrane protein insertase